MQFKVWEYWHDESEAELVEAESRELAAEQFARKLAARLPAWSVAEGLTIMVRTPLGVLAEIDFACEFAPTLRIESVSEPEADTSIMTRSILHGG